MTDENLIDKFMQFAKTYCGMTSRYLDSDEFSMKGYSHGGDVIAFCLPVMAFTSPATLAEALKAVCDGFDPDEYAVEIYERDRGESGRLKDLLEDAESIKDTYRRLYRYAVTIQAEYEAKEVSHD